MLMTAAQREEWISKIMTGDYDDGSLVELIRDQLSEPAEIDFLHDRNWGILEVVRGTNVLSSDEAAAEEEARSIQEMLDHWNSVLGGHVFGYGIQHP